MSLGECIFLKYKTKLIIYRGYDQILNFLFYIKRTYFFLKNVQTDRRNSYVNMGYLSSNTCIV